MSARNKFFIRDRARGKETNKKRAPYHLKPISMLPSENNAPLSVGRLRLEFGPMVSPQQLEEVAQSRRRSSVDCYQKWLEVKKSHPAPCIEEEPTLSVRHEIKVHLNTIKGRRKNSMGAYDKWCAEKDATRRQSIQEEMLRRVQESAIRQQILEAELEHDAHVVDATEDFLRSENAKAFRNDMHSIGLDNAPEGVAIAVMDMRLAIDEAIHKTPSPRPVRHRLPAL
jgi:hypothetical protein